MIDLFWYAARRMEVLALFFSQSLLPALNFPQIRSLKKTRRWICALSIHSPQAFPGQSRWAWNLSQNAPGTRQWTSLDGMPVESVYKRKFTPTKDDSQHRWLCKFRFVHLSGLFWGAASLIKRTELDTRQAYCADVVSAGRQDVWRLRWMIWV